MAAFAHSAPCWVDVQLPDLEAGKRFYGELFGWTFRAGEEVDRGGPCVDALSGGKLVAALAAKQDGRMPTAWGVYFATDDIVATVTRIRQAGGQVITEPVRVGGAGVLAQAADPGGAVFGVWQAGDRGGFQKQNEPGSFCWTEVYTRQKDRVDAFYEKVFGFRGTDLGAVGKRESGRGESGTGESRKGGSETSGSDTAGSEAPESGISGSGADVPGVDFRMWSPAGTEPGPDTAIGGRSVITEAFPAEMPSYFLNYFAVADCDATAETGVHLGGRVSVPPFDIPYGRMAVLHDNQGAEFAVLQPPVSR
ncbi:VOC family protein [Streptomyces sp. NBC_00121]|uniref:VOC family protein n=1 Tax=unclassified Streptomyces TaxID=2593676 RepID=UPI002DD87425|nr:VOC family protein [Streptomyces sp. NBC_01760]WSC70958.1 VOC family protein [Streptomyces sp. NBC_01760]WTE61433.1 VOC family protein [Streptomyces sp. NBC_01617]WTI88848.1 VOC family protein [Streptomyces sp. NBC_00724]